MVWDMTKPFGKVFDQAGLVRTKSTIAIETFRIFIMLLLMRRDNRQLVANGKVEVSWVLWIHPVVDAVNFPSGTFFSQSHFQCLVAESRASLQCHADGCLLSLNCRPLTLRCFSPKLHPNPAHR